MRGWVVDLGQALASLRRSPGFALAAALTAGLGIGASTATFSVVEAVLLRPLPWAEPERLVSVWPEFNFNATMVQRVRDGVPALERVSGVSQWELTLTRDGEEPVVVQASLVTPSHFEILGVRPLLGRGFEEADARPGAEGVVVLGHDLWVQRYGADPSIPGRVLELGGADRDRRRVVGVLPPDHRPLRPGTRVWVPLEWDPALGFGGDRTWYVNHRVGRLAPGATLEQARAQLRSVVSALRDESPSLISAEDVQTVSVVPLHEAVVGGAEEALVVLGAAVALVLLIACANVANLLLARGERRTRELAVRRALGAGRLRLARQLLTEGLLLGLAGGVVGVGVAAALLRLLVGGLAEDLPRASSAGLDLPVLGFALAASVIAAALFSALPALRGSGTRARAALRQAGALGAHRGASRWLAAAELALAVVLVAASALMLRTLQRLYDVDPGFEPEGVLAVRPQPPDASYPEPGEVARYNQRVVERLRGVPGVSGVGGIQLRPLELGNWSFPIWPQGHDVPEGSPPPTANFRIVTPGYFETMRIPIERGRPIEERDVAEGPAVALVNRAFAERFWPGEDPLGREVRLLQSDAEPRQVIGVVGDVRQHALDRAAQPEVYVPPAQWPWAVSLWYMIRAESGDPAALAPAVRTALSSVDPDVPLGGFETMDAVAERSAGQRRFAALLLAVFGGLALLLAAVGVYAVTAFSVARRTSEFGLRVALGATPRDLLSTAMADGGTPLAVGLAVGVAAAVLVTRGMRSLLFGVEPGDPLTLAAVAALLALAATAASLLPARRAARVDPMVALRDE